MENIILVPKIQTSDYNYFIYRTLHTPLLESKGFHFVFINEVTLEEILSFLKSCKIAVFSHTCFRLYKEVLAKESFPCKKIVIIDDIHLAYRHWPNMKWFDHAIAPCGYYPHTKRISIPTTLWPHCSELVEFNETPKNKIVITGRVSPKWYPMRSKALKLQHPGVINYQRKKRIHTGFDFLNMLSSHLAAFTSSGKPGYVVRKFFQIPATGALLIGHLLPCAMKVFEELGFIDMHNFVRVTTDNMKEKFDWVLDPKNREEVDAIRRRGYEHVKAHHTRLHRSQELAAICETLLS